MKILFVCRHNRFRSKIAESYFNKINKNESLVCESAGIFPGSFPLDKVEKKVAKKLGIEIKGRPQPITTNLLGWQDVIIAITDDLPSGLFNYSIHKNKVINWKIPDELNDNEKNIEKTIKKIMKRIDKIIK